MRNICVIFDGHSAGSVAWLVSSYFNFSSLLVGGPLAYVLVTRLLDVGVGPSNDSALGYWLMSNIVSILEISLGVNVARLVISGLIIESLISCGLILFNNSVGLFWLITLVIRVVLGVIVLNSFYLIRIILLYIDISLVSLIFWIINLSILIVSYCGFTWGGFLSAVLLLVVALKVVGICLVIDYVVLFTRFAWLLNTLLLHISHS